MNHPIRTTLMASAALLALSSVSSSAADQHIKTQRCNGVSDYHDCLIVRITGSIVDGDADTFRRYLDGVKHATVILASTGGSLAQGLEIGEMIHDLSYDTYVPADSMCASSCANIWMAGAKHTIGPNGTAAFHTAYDRSDGKHADGLGNVVTGVYYAHIGYSYQQAIKLFGHDPSHFYVLKATADGDLIEKTVDIK